MTSLLVWRGSLSDLATDLRSVLNLEQRRALGEALVSGRAPPRRYDGEQTIVHKLVSGFAYCGFSGEVPGKWPAQHRWDNDPGLVNVNCVHCLRGEPWRMPAIPREGRWECAAVHQLRHVVLECESSQFESAPPLQTHHVLVTREDSAAFWGATFSPPHAWKPGEHLALEDILSARSQSTAIQFPKYAWRVKHEGQSYPWPDGG